MVVLHVQKVVGSGHQGSLGDLGPHPMASTERRASLAEVEPLEEGGNRGDLVGFFIECLLTWHGQAVGGDGRPHAGLVAGVWLWRRCDLCTDPLVPCSFRKI